MKWNQQGKFGSVTGGHKYAFMNQALPSLNNQTTDLHTFRSWQVHQTWQHHVSRQRQKKTRGRPSLPPSSEFPFLLIFSGCQPAQINSAQEQVFSLLTHWVRCCRQNFSISKHRNSSAPSELMCYCILMKFVRMVVSPCAVVHTISRRHAAAHVCPPLSVRCSHTLLIHYLLKPVLSFHLVSFCINACLRTRFKLFFFNS